MPDNKDVITALSVFAVVPVSDLDSSIGWYTRLIGREPDSQPMDGLADYFLASDRDPDHGTLQLVVDAKRAGGGLVTINAADAHAVASVLAKNGIDFQRRRHHLGQRAVRHGPRSRWKRRHRRRTTRLSSLE